MKDNSLGGGVPTVGQNSKKKATSTSAKASTTAQDKDGCFRVPGYRGVWVDPKGKHFIKIDGKALTNENDTGPVAETTSGCVLFESSDDAARKYDETMKQREAAELNFKSDGSRIAYDEETSSAVAGRGLEMLGGGASSVVPALSVINIKVRVNVAK